MFYIFPTQKRTRQQMRWTGKSSHRRGHWQSHHFIHSIHVFKFCTQRSKIIATGKLPMIENTFRSLSCPFFLSTKVSGCCQNVSAWLTPHYTSALFKFGWLGRRFFGTYATHDERMQVSRHWHWEQSVGNFTLRWDEPREEKTHGNHCIEG